MSHTFLTCAGRKAAQRTSESIKTTEIAWTGVHTIIKSGTCLLYTLRDAIGWLTWHHVATREALDLHQKRIPHDRDQTVHLPKVPSDGPNDSWKNSTIAVRSNRDRGAIEPRVAHHSSWKHLHDHRTVAVGASIPQSMHHRGPIAAWSWPDRGAIMVLFEMKLKLTHRHIGAELKPRSTPKESLPRPRQIAPTTASIGHDLLENFPFKNRCISLFFFNFWLIREEIKKISRKISSSSWSPRV